MENLVDILSYFLAGRVLKKLSVQSKVLIVNCLPGEYLSALTQKTSNITLVQRNKIQYDLITKTEIDCVASIEEVVDSSYDMILYFGTKYKQVNLHIYAKAYDLLKPRANFIVVHANRTGAKSNTKYIAEIFTDVTSFSKYRGRLIIGVKGELNNPALHEEWSQFSQPISIEKTELMTYFGTHSVKNLDLGSKILLENIPNLKGVGADLGSGYGYLSYSLIFKCAAISQIDLFEVDYYALKASRINLDNIPEKLNKRKSAQRSLPQINFYWADVQNIVFKNQYDWVVMNPPFHSGIKEDVDLGRAFLLAGYNILKEGGHLYVVANRHLPYESYIQSIFSQWQKLYEGQGFKVYDLIKQ